ncbi:MAG TPA: DUF2867 domain-containing protein [Solirubrobacteraceae bacterium]|jgi:hypothetical protein|nr:DUF2867 domain-containing protein [Solirubrobacteraceae bacterium]
MRLPNAAQAQHGWLIDQIVPDFKLLDVWRLPVDGGPDDFPALVEVLNSLDPTSGDSRAARALFRLRLRIGELFGWDRASDDRSVPGRSERSLSERVPEALRGSALGADGRRPGVGSVRFTPLYRTDRESAAEISNRTVHGVLHLGWVGQRDGSYHGQMAVYVKTRGRLGEAYMALIGPFRHLIVYPALMRQIARAWAARAA